MAQFRGLVTGNRGTGSRLGTKASGIHVEANGWSRGIRVDAYFDELSQNDVFEVWATGGSEASTRPRLIGTF